MTADTVGSGASKARGYHLAAISLDPRQCGHRLSADCLVYLPQSDQALVRVQVISP